VISNTNLCSVKNLSIVHELPPQYPAGVPRLRVSIPSLALVTAEGTLALSKNQMEIPLSASSVTNTPPPLDAKSAPYDFRSETVMPQPEFELDS
jgi:hypothetical protein